MAVRKEGKLFPVVPPMSVLGPLSNGEDPDHQCLTQGDPVACLLPVRFPLSGGGAFGLSLGAVGNRDDIVACCMKGRLLPVLKHGSRSLLLMQV